MTHFINLTQELVRKRQFLANAAVSTTQVHICDCFFWNKSKGLYTPAYFTLVRAGTTSHKSLNFKFPYLRLHNTYAL